MTTAQTTASERSAAEPSHFLLLLSITATLSAFFWSFALAIHQPVGRRRWLCLPVILSGPAIHALGLCYSALFPRNFLLWIWTFTVVIWTLHATSVLYIEGTVVSRPVTGGWNWLAVRKGWNNPRRIAAATTNPTELSLTVSLASRARFSLVRILFLLLLSATWMASFFVCIFFLKIRPRDLDPPVYISFSLNRSGLIRAVSVLQWIWGCYCILTAVHFAMSIIFVSILGLDLPKEWPPLWGDIRTSSSIRAFWGRFWHRIGTASQISYARALIRMLGLRQGSPPAKILTSFCVFALSGLTHSVANWAMSSGNGTLKDDSMRDVIFLLLNFAAGLAEALSSRIFYIVLPSLKWRMPLWMSRLSMRVFGFAWVFCFLFCVVPPYQYPVLQQALNGFMPDIRINAQQGPLLEPMQWEEFNRLRGDHR